jgi:molybdopterin/thiamine biosynthesis adenylyltransferase
MISANELRVTNFVLNDGVVNSVIMIGYDSVELITKQGNTITARLDLIEPIKLTEEWLLKLGGKLLMAGAIFRFSINEFMIIDCEAIVGCYEIYIKTKASGFSIGTGKTKVHELQNLIFALKGEELNYNA